MKNRYSGYTLIEYTLVLGAVMVAVVGMNMYIRRSIQGQLKKSLDDIGVRYEYGGKTSSLSTTNSSRAIITNVRRLPKSTSGLEHDIYYSITDVPLDKKVITLNETVKP